MDLQKLKYKCASFGIPQKIKVLFIFVLAGCFSNRDIDHNPALKDQWDKNRQDFKENVLSSRISVQRADGSAGQLDPEKHAALKKRIDIANAAVLSLHLGEEEAKKHFLNHGMDKKFWKQNSDEINRLVWNQDLLHQELSTLNGDLKKIDLKLNTTKPKNLGSAYRSANRANRAEAENMEEKILDASPVDSFRTLQDEFHNVVLLYGALENSFDRTFLGAYANQKIEEFFSAKACAPKSPCNGTARLLNDEADEYLRKTEGKHDSDSYWYDEEKYPGQD